MTDRKRPSIESDLPHHLRSVAQDDGIEWRDPRDGLQDADFDGDPDDYKFYPDYDPDRDRKDVPVRRLILRSRGSEGLSDVLRDIRIVGKQLAIIKSAAKIS